MIYGILVMYFILVFRSPRQPGSTTIITFGAEHIEMVIVLLFMTRTIFLRHFIWVMPGFIISWFGNFFYRGFSLFPS